MSVFAILYFLSDQIKATPLPSSSLSSIAGSPEDTVFARTHLLSDPNRQLFISRIVWSCLFTVLSSAWVTVHPNAPCIHDSQWRRTLRRVEVVIWALVVPEFMVCWAVRQWIGARNLKERYRSPGWTITHAHFLQMGGWVITYRDKASSFTWSQPSVQVLSPPLLDTLLSPHSQPNSGTPPPIFDISAITPPLHILISHSTSDPLFTAIAVLQTLWFLIQCIARAASGGKVLRIELVTLAYVVMYMVMYVIWWDKPMDIRAVRRVVLRKPDELEGILKRVKDALFERKEEDGNVEAFNDFAFRISPSFGDHGIDRDRLVNARNRENSNEISPSQNVGNIGNDSDQWKPLVGSLTPQFPSTSSVLLHRKASDESVSTSTNSDDYPHSSPNTSGIRNDVFLEVSHPDELRSPEDTIQNLNSGIEFRSVVLKPYPNPQVDVLEDANLLIPLSTPKKDIQPAKRITRTRSLDFSLRRKQAYVDSGGTLSHTLFSSDVGRQLKEWRTKDGSNVFDTHPTLPTPPNASDLGETQEPSTSFLTALTSTLDPHHSDDDRQTMSRISESFGACGSASSSSSDGSSTSVASYSPPTLKAFPAHPTVGDRDGDSIPLHSPSSTQNCDNDMPTSVQSFVSRRLKALTPTSDVSTAAIQVGGSSETAVDIEEVLRFPTLPRIQVTRSSSTSDSLHTRHTSMQRGASLRVDFGSDHEFRSSYPFNLRSSAQPTPITSRVPFPIPDDDANCHRNNPTRSRNAPPPVDMNVSFATAEDDTIFDSLWEAVRSGRFAGLTGLDKVMKRVGDIVVGFSNNPDVDVRMGRFELDPSEAEAESAEGEEGRRRQKQKKKQRERIPTFYATSSDSSYDDRVFKLFSGCLATFFGAVHLIAWNFPFSLTSPVTTLSSTSLSTYPSILLLIWRVSSLISISVPLLAAFAMLGLSERGSEGVQLTFTFMALEFTIFPFTLLYIPARAMLIVLPIVELVGIGKGWGGEMGTDSIWGTVVWWTKFFPHIQ